MIGIFKNIHIREINFNLGNIIYRFIPMSVDAGGNNRFSQEFNQFNGKKMVWNADTI